jgi:hypothetical protein
MGTAHLLKGAHHRFPRRAWRLAAARPPHTRRGVSPRRDRGRQADHGAAAAATARALARGFRTFGGRWRARSGGWTRQRRARSWWQAGPGRRAGGGERAGARVGRRCRRARCTAAGAATAPPGPPTREWPGHRRPDCWTAGAERVRQGRVSGAAQLQPPRPRPEPQPLSRERWGFGAAARVFRVALGARRARCARPLALATTPGQRAHQLHAHPRTITIITAPPRPSDSSRTETPSKDPSAC